MKHMKPYRNSGGRLVGWLALAWIACAVIAAVAHADVIKRAAVVGQQVLLTNDVPATWQIPNRATITGKTAVSLTFSSPGERLITVTPGPDVDLTVTIGTTPPPTTQPETPPTSQPAGNVRKITALAFQPVFLNAPGLDARWDMPALPDGTPPRSYMGPFFAWAFEVPGVYPITVSPGPSYEVTVTAAAPAIVVRLPPGRQTIRKTINTARTWYVAADPAHPPIINGGFTVEAPDCYFGDLKFDGDTDVNRAAIQCGRNGSFYANRIDLGSIGGGIKCEVATGIGAVARNVTAGSGVRKYPFGSFSGRNLALFDFRFLSYSGIEHPIRIDGNSTDSGHTYIPSRNILIAYGIAQRVSNGKEPLTIRQAEDTSIHNVLMQNGYAVRLCWDKAERDLPSKNLYLRDSVFDNCPVDVYSSGVNGLTVTGNHFQNLGSKAPPIHYNPSGERTANVREGPNVWAGGTGAMHTANALQITGFVAR